LLRTERLFLRKPQLDDADRAAWLTDPEVMRWLGGIDPPTDVVRRWVEDWEVYPVGKFIVERAGVVIGRVGLNFYDPVRWVRSAAADAVPELGWALAREHWGHGYATEAAAAVGDWFGGSGVVSLIAPDNLRSQRVAGRLGAVPTECVTLSDSSEAVVWLHLPRSRPSAFSSAARG